MLSLFFFISLIISMILIILNSLIGEKMMFSREMNSAFECGFDPKSMARLPFSLHFYLIALIFLIFDVEITLLIPIPLITKSSMTWFMWSLVMFFVMVLVIGIMIEWKAGALEWSY